jgi:DNA mismatch endonuclease, patch repair protein
MKRALRQKLPQGRFVNVTSTRSAIMRAIHNTDNRTTERRLRFALVRAGISGWKINDKSIEGKPDFFFPVYNLTVFVDGCFWHGCTKCGHIPKTNKSFWVTKIRCNKERDKLVGLQLRKIGYLVLRFWEHEIMEDITSCVEKIQSLI